MPELEPYLQGQQIRDLLKRCSQLGSQIMVDRLAAHDLTVPQFLVLNQVSLEPGITLLELANRLNLAGSTVSAMVARLEKRSLLLRCRDRDDRRTVHIELTQAAAGITSGFQELRHTLFSSLFGQLSPEETANIIAALETLERVLMAQAASHERSPTAGPRKVRPHCRRQASREQ